MTNKTREGLQQLDRVLGYLKTDPRKSLTPVEKVIGHAMHEIIRTDQDRCPIHNIPLEVYVIKGGIWLGPGKGFDIVPRTRKTCPQCEEV